MAYRRFHRAARPQVRVITAKFPGPCACCGAPIAAGEMVEYFPVGTIAGRDTAAIAHVGGLDGTGAKCSVELRKRHVDAAVNDYAGDGLDARYEDAGADICGL